MPYGRIQGASLKLTILGTLLLTAWIPAPAQDILAPASLEDLLRLNRGNVVDAGSLNKTPISPKASAQRLATAWNHLIDQVRANESRFTHSESHELDAVLQHIQGGLPLVGLAPAGNEKLPYSLRDLDQLVPNTSALRVFLEQKYRQNPKVRPFKSLSREARTVDQEARRLSPTVAAAQPPGL